MRLEVQQEERDPRQQAVEFLLFATLATVPIEKIQGVVSELQGGLLDSLIVIEEKVRRMGTEHQQQLCKACSEYIFQTAHLTASTRQLHTRMGSAAHSQIIKVMQDNLEKAEGTIGTLLGDELLNYSLLAALHDLA